MAPRVQRRSDRHRSVVTRYTDDVFEVAGLIDESAETELSGDEQKDVSDLSDEEFNISGDNRAKKTRPLETNSDDDLISDFDNLRDSQDKSAARVKGLYVQGTRSRGVLNPSEHSSRPLQLKLTFGTNVQDLLPMVYARDRWSKGIDSTFPSRETIGEPSNIPSYGIGTTFGVDEDQLLRESTKAWDWYYQEAAGGSFRKKQRMERMRQAEIQRYLPKEKIKRHTVLIGPAAKQSVYMLSRGESFNFGAAWGEMGAKGKKRGQGKKANKQAVSAENLQEATPIDVESAFTADGNPMPRPQRVREGWILNLGNRVQCLAWAPNCSGISQYLAVSVPITEQQKIAVGETATRGAPAFSCSAPYPAAIQIWSFGSIRVDQVSRKLDMSVKPRLCLVACSDAGDIKRLSWCPMPRSRRKEDDNEEDINIGLLGGIWGDGTLKVLDIQLSKRSNEAQYVKVHAPAFEARPPSTLCTSLCWLSPSDIAVGCANGFVAAWSLSNSGIIRPESTPVPFFYYPIHNTYVLSLVSAYPTHPHLIATTAMDGQIRISSLLDPQADTTDAPRMRLSSPHLSYSAFLRSFLVTDETDFIRLLPIRRFFSTISALKSLSAVSAMAPGSPCHPSILAGNGGGMVIATNPLRKVLYTKEKHWQQTWFRHEWVPGQELAGEEGETGGPGISKFYDGFKVENVKLFRSMMGDKRLVNGVLTVTIFEEGTGVTAVAWNPNQVCAGWACAGLGCGLLRVEDLAI